MEKWQEVAPETRLETSKTPFGDHPDQMEVIQTRLEV